MSAEYKLEKVDPFYTLYSSGVKCIYGTAGLFHEKQLKAFYSLEQGLLHIGLLLCTSRRDKQIFFNRFAVPYNERLKAKQAKQDSNQTAKTTHPKNHHQWDVTRSTPIQSG